MCEEAGGKRVACVWRIRRWARAAEILAQQLCVNEANLLSSSSEKRPDFPVKWAGTALCLSLTH